MNDAVSGSTNKLPTFFDLREEKRDVVTKESLGAYLEKKFDVYPGGYTTTQGGYPVNFKEKVHVPRGDRSNLTSPSISDGTGYLFENEPDELAAFKAAGWPVEEAIKDVNDAWFGNVSFHPVTYAKWFIKNSGYDSDGDGKINVKEAVDNQDTAKYKLGDDFSLQALPQQTCSMDLCRRKSKWSHR